MGCGLSSDPEKGAALASGPGAKRFFYLEDLPLSICASPEGSNGMKLRLVGPAECTSDAMWRLETAIEKRGLSVKEAQMSQVAGLVQFLFSLKGVAAAMAAFADFISPQKTSHMTYDSLKVRLERVQIEQLPAWVAGEAEKMGAGDSLKDVAEFLHVSVDYSYEVGGHAALLQAASRLEGSVVGAKLQTHGGSLRDELWLQPLKGGVGAGAGGDIATSLKMNFNAALAELNLTTYVPADATPVKFFHAKNVDSLVNAIKETDAEKLGTHAINLPPALQKVLRGLPYAVMSSTNGVQIDGFEKFVGAGWIPTETKVLPRKPDAPPEAELPPTLEIRTLFARRRATGDGAPAKGSPNKGFSNGFGDHMRRWIGSGNEYAEFCTWLDVPSRTWTIWKVFLNGVLPGGNNYGARLIAEHLAGDPQMFFGSSPSRSDNMPELLGAVAELQVIHICDVVNWNTYLMMSIAASETRDTQLFGLHMGPLVNEELAASKLTLDELKTASSVDIFSKTALGKLTRNILGIWNNKLDIDLHMTDVSVNFVDTAFETIAGEERHMMMLRVSVGSSRRSNTGSTAPEVSKALVV